MESILDAHVPSQDLLYSAFFQSLYLLPFILIGYILSRKFVRHKSFCMQRVSASQIIFKMGFSTELHSNPEIIYHSIH